MEKHTNEGQKKKVTFLLDDELHTWLKFQSVKENRPGSRIVEALLREYRRNCEHPSG